MNAKTFFVPNDTTDEIRAVWKNRPRLTKSMGGGSTKALSDRWANARGFPLEVQNTFKKSGFSALKNLKFKRGYPGYEVRLDGDGIGSLNDIFVYAHGTKKFVCIKFLCARGAKKPVCITVEGKKMPSEKFGELVQDWRNIYPGHNREERLSGLLKVIELDMAKVQTLRYQLIHRAASPLIEAKKKPGCKTAVMLVHAFGLMPDNFRDFEKFAKAMDVKGKAHENCIHYAKTIGGIDLYLGWING